MALILLYLSLVVSLYAVRDFSFQVIAAVFVSVFLLFIPSKRVKSGFIPISMFLVFTFGGNLFFHPGKILYGSGLFSVTDEGLVAAAVRTLRVFTMIYGAKVLTSLLPLEEIIEIMNRLLGPFERIGLPVKEFFSIMGLTVKSFPLLTEHLSKAYREGKQKNEIKGFRNRLRYGVSFMLPVFIESIRSPERFFVSENSKS